MTFYELETNLIKDIEECFIATEKANNKFEAYPTFYNQYHSTVKIPDEKQEDANYIWNEDLYNYFNSIAPEGHYFGSNEGDGACIGFFKSEENEEY